MRPARPLAAVAALLLLGPGAAGLAGCSGPCDDACEVLVEQCGLQIDSYAQAPAGTGRGCRDVDPGAGLDLALCREQCQDWQAEGAECVAALQCSTPADDDGAVLACLEGRGRADGKRDTTAASSCRQDCDQQARACGDTCETAAGDTPTCAGCYDNCDRARARCRGWCVLIGQ